MLHLYYKTAFEEKIEHLFKSKGIVQPEDLCLEKLSDLFKVQIVYIPNAPQRAMWDDNLSVIFLDSAKTPAEVREVFFHELAHPLLHEGNQLGMFPEFRNLQENQAKVFQLYAAMPLILLKNGQRKHLDFWTSFIDRPVFGGDCICNPLFIMII
ncbi:protein of unknown function DUF955, partial [Caldalkalibacillus thermarum TA2.A1]